EGDQVVFEQRLDLLKLGRGVRAYGEGEQGHAGAIAAVELRMVGSVPMLAVTVAFDDADAAAPLGALEHDTEPDLDAPAEPGVKPTLVEFDDAQAHARALGRARVPAPAPAPALAPAHAPDDLDPEVELSA